MFDGYKILGLAKCRVAQDVFDRLAERLAYLHAHGKDFVCLLVRWKVAVPPACDYLGRYLTEGRDEQNTTKIGVAPLLVQPVESLGNIFIVVPGVRHDDLGFHPILLILVLFAGI